MVSKESSVLNLLLGAGEAGRMLMLYVVGDI